MPKLSTSSSAIICFATVVIFFVFFVILAAFAYSNDYNCNSDLDCNYQYYCSTQSTCVCRTYSCNGSYYYWYGYDDNNWVAFIFFLFMFGFIAFLLTAWCYWNPSVDRHKVTMNENIPHVEHGVNNDLYEQQQL